MLYKKIRTPILSRDVGRAAENTVRLKYAENFILRGVFVGEGVKSVYRQNHVEKIIAKRKFADIALYKGNVRQT